MIIKMTTTEGFNLEFYEVDDVVFVEKVGDKVLLQWYYEDTDVVQHKTFKDIATLELEQ